MHAAVVVFSTFPNIEKARTVGHYLVEENLAACVSVHESGVCSIYRWKGKIAEEHEALAIIKTTSDRVEALTTRIVALHPYELPEVIAVPIVDGHAPYLAWLAAETTAR